MTFRFTIADLAVYLGKAPATIRSWERKGLIRLPREGNKRVLTAEEVYEAAWVAYQAKRITEQRWGLIGEAIAALRAIEWEDE